MVARVLALLVTSSALLFTKEAAADELAPPTTVSVHIDTPEPVELQMQQGDEWIPVCSSPCDRVVSTTNLYRIDGSGVRTSKPFRIMGNGKVRLDVEPTSSANHAIGVVVVVTGGVGLVPAVGVTAAVVGGVAVSAVLICPIVAVFGQTFFGAYGECLVDIAVDIGKLYANPWVWAPALSGLVIAASGGALLASSSSTQVNMWSTNANTAALPPVRTMPLLRFAF